MTEKSYALIKNGIVVNTVVLDNPDNLLKLNVIEHYDADDCVIIPDEELSFVETGTLWNGAVFNAPQPFPSWIWNENTRAWKAPISKPEQTDPTIVKVYEWDESILNWVENSELSYAVTLDSAPLPQE